MVNAEVDPREYRGVHAVCSGWSAHAGDRRLPLSAAQEERMIKRNLASMAMLFARDAHKDQVRKYTGEPYHCHLAEVVAISMSTGWRHPMIHPDSFMAVGWLHDVMEDCEVDRDELHQRFGFEVAIGVYLLSDLETEGNRAQRKRASRERLSTAPSWVQTIKYADLISNTYSIVRHDPEFAKVYLQEKRDLLEVMDRGDPVLRSMAMELSEAA
jgi:GTP diphosphokinase / guanosine-3',5'-bis(diphosphate) 3'-diphosphatase